MERLRIGIVVGEPSGDTLAAALICSLRAQQPQCDFVGVTGPKMREAGCETLFSLDELAVMGIVDVLACLPRLLKRRREVSDYFIENPPDVFIGIDAPDFNLGLEEKLKKAGITVVHYTSPTIWAWRKDRIHKIKRAVDLMLTLLPFEAALYEAQNIPVRYVGHPLADQITPEVNNGAVREEFNLAPTDKVIAILPGSRSTEIKYMGKLFIETARWCWQQDPEIKFIAPMLNDKRRNEFEALLQQHAPDLPIQLIDGKAQQVMIASDVVLLVSGTATLEAMLLARPMVVAYVTSKLNYLIAKLLVRTDHIALPNILAGQALVPEYLQSQATVEHLGRDLLLRLNQPQDELIDEFKKMYHALRRDASEQAAIAIFSLLATKKAGNHKDL